MAEALKKLNVPVTVVLDAAVGYIRLLLKAKKVSHIVNLGTYLFSSLSVTFHRYVMEKVDLVIVGAEGVVESGGIINKVCSVKSQGSVSCLSPTYPEKSILRF